MNSSILNKFKGARLGFAVGDAIGVPVEFLKRETLLKKPITEMIGYGSHNVPAGTWSDDTSLTIATIDSIIDCKRIDYDDIMYKFNEWYDNAKYTATDRVFDIGISTSKAISKFKNGLKPLECGGNTLYENGNGSLMRMLPFVFYLNLKDYDNDNIVKTINDASSLTHAHPISRLACNIYYDFVSLILKGCSKEVAYLELQKKYDSGYYSMYFNDNAIDNFRNIFSGKLAELKKDDIKSTGFVVDTLEACMWCILNTSSFEESIINAVNLGDDTDTIGAITGSMSGIIYGIDNIPKKWSDKLIKKEYLLDLAGNFEKDLDEYNLLKK